MVVGEVPRGARTQTGGSTPGSAVQAVAVRGTELVVTAQAVSVEPVTEGRGWIEGASQCFEGQEMSMLLWGRHACRVEPA